MELLQRRKRLDALLPIRCRRRAGAGIQLQPDHASFRGREIVVFQAQKVGEDNYQVYLKESRDGGATWDAARSITGQPAFAQKVEGTDNSPNNFSNQRPRIAALGNVLGLAWERTLLGRTTPNLYYCDLDENGGVVRGMERVDPADGSLFAQIIPLGTREMLIYEQSASGAYRVVLSERTKAWTPEVIGRGLAGSSQSPHGIVFKGALYLFWEVRAAASSSLVALRPKTTVSSPALIAVGFQPGVPVRSDVATIRWKQPEDSVGIESYDVTVSEGGAVVERKSLSADSADMTFTRPVSRDGTWHVEVVARDIAGNRSRPVAMDFVRDTTPPHAVVLTPPPQDAEGFQPSNSVSVAWTPAGDKDVAGYTWEEQRVSGSMAEYEANKVNLIQPPDRPLTTGTSLSFSNLENGVHVLTVKAIDRAGNVSLPASIVLQLNKFQAFTAIYSVQRNEDDLGNVLLTLRGRGFITNGSVKELYLSRSDKPPYDRVFTPGQDGFIVDGDTRISGPRLGNSFPAGSYLVGILQKEGRPYFWSDGRVDFEPPGTVRLGTFNVLLPRWVGFGLPRYGTSFDSLIMVLVVALLGIIAIVSARKMAALAQEGAQIRSEVLALLEGRPSAAWEERKTRMKELQKKGLGLRLKFTLLMVVLVTIIVLIVSVPLGVQMIGQQSQSLADGLDKRTRLLIGTIAASAEAEIRKGTANGGDVGIGTVPDTIKPLEEARFTTITGPADALRFPNTPARDFVWASNSDAWNKRKASRTFEVAMEQEKDALSATRRPRSAEEDQRGGAARACGRACRLAEAARPLPGAGVKARPHGRGTGGVRRHPEGPAEKSGQYRLGAQDPPRERRAQPAAVRPAQAACTPVPLLQADRLLCSRRQVLLPGPRPPGGRHHHDHAPDRGSPRNGLIRSTALIALAAIALGILGAIIMASITVTPIRRLAQGVAVIRDTEDKEAAEGPHHQRPHPRRDRPARRDRERHDAGSREGRGRQQGAAARQGRAEDVPAPREGRGGQEGNARRGRKARVWRSTATTRAPRESRETTSTSRSSTTPTTPSSSATWRARECPRRSSWSRWPPSSSATSATGPSARRTSPASRTRRSGRQPCASWTGSTPWCTRSTTCSRSGASRAGSRPSPSCIFNAETGTATICNAGDNILHVYAAGQGRMVQNKLPGVSRGGRFPSMLVEMKSGFPQVPQKLDKGDALFLFTDGFEEAKRSFRNAQWRSRFLRRARHQGGRAAPGHPYQGPDLGGVRDSADRRPLISAVFSRGRYRLVRTTSPDASEELEFDFATCSGTVKDAVLALVAVEKVSG